MLDLLVLADINPDLIVLGLEGTPRFGQAEQFVDGAELVLGGSGCITACGAAALGLAVGVVGVVGDDRFGAFALDALTARGVQTRDVIVDPARPTGVCVHLTRGDDRAMLTSLGTLGDLRGDRVDPALLAAARHVHVGAYFLQRGLQRDLPGLFAEARRHGATTSLDPNWDPAQTWDGGLRDVLRETDVLLCNEGEAAAITGRPTVEAALSELAATVGTVVVKRGAQGAVAVRDGADPVVAAAPLIEDYRDAVGAGDSFDAGFIAGTLAGHPLDACLRLGAACGSLSVRGVGGTAAQPDAATAWAWAERLATGTAQA